jgi:tetratricopeptide (TPR) repeat protein
MKIKKTIDLGEYIVDISYEKETGYISVDVYDEAEELIKMGFEQDRKNYDLLVSAGDVYLEKNDGGNAATFYERAIAIDPKNPKAFVRVSVIWIRVKNYEQAQLDLNKAFEKDPNYAQAWKYQAELYYAQRKFALAKEAYGKYIDFSEPSIANQVRFVRILFLSKAYDEALERIEAAPAPTCSLCIGVFDFKAGSVQIARIVNFSVH